MRARKKARDYRITEKEVSVLVKAVLSSDKTKLILSSGKRLIDMSSAPSYFEIMGVRVSTDEALCYHDLAERVNLVCSKSKKLKKLFYKAVKLKTNLKPQEAFSVIKKLNASFGLNRAYAVNFFFSGIVDNKEYLVRVDTQQKPNLKKREIRKIAKKIFELQLQIEKLRIDKDWLKKAS